MLDKRRSSATNTVVSPSQRRLSLDLQLQSLMLLMMSHRFVRPRLNGLQPLGQLRPPAPARNVAYGNGDGLLLSNQHYQPLAPSDARIKEVPLQHGVMLRHDRNNHGWILRALTLMNGSSVRGHQHVELAKPVGDGSAVKVDNELALRRIDIIDVANVTI